MTRFTSLAVASLLVVGATAFYGRANIDYTASLDCTSCIRAGYNFCIDMKAQTNATVSSWTCDQNDRKPNAQASTGGVANGYICSKALTDEMSAIINGCRPWLNQNVGDFCGSYFIDLSQNTGFAVGRSIISMTKNSSCTYRASSACGYPQAEWRIHNPEIAEDFDITWARNEGISADNDLDGWNFTLSTDDNGTYQSSSSSNFATIGPKGLAKVSDEQWGKCNGPTRNLWVTITRTKESKPPRAFGEHLAATPRQLQSPYYPNGTFFPDFDISFTNVQSSGAAILGAVSIAFAAGLAALAF